MLYITYDAISHQDGAGAQLLRIVSAYLISKYYNIGYIHTPLLHIGNYGLLCLEEKKEDITQIIRYNKLFNFVSDTINNNVNIIKLHSIDSRIIEYKNNAIDKDILLNVLYPIFEINSNPDILTITNAVNFSWLETKINSTLKVCIHIRRGDILLIEKDIRYMNNSYYINIMRQLQQKINIPFEFHVYTENVTKPTTFTSEYRYDLVGVNSMLEPDSYNEFNEFNVIWHINTDPVDSFVDLCNADILIISISAYSYLAALLNKKAIVIYPIRYSHPPKKEWIVLDNENSIIDKFTELYDTTQSIVYDTMQSIVYITGGALGDMINQICVIYEVYIKTGKKGILYISNTARNPHGFTFSIEKTYDDTYKLITDQPYIESYHIHNNEPFDVNLSSWIVNQQLYINNYDTIYLEEYGVTFCNNKYLDIEYDSKYKDCIFISSSIKRFNSSIDYNKLIESLPCRPIFVTSTISEYEFFKNTTGIDLEYMCFDRLYDLYIAINSCKLFIGNLSSPLCVAQAIMKPRIYILNSNYNENDNMHINGLDNKWKNCLFIYNTCDIDNVSEFYNKL